MPKMMSDEVADQRIKQRVHAEIMYRKENDVMDSEDHHMNYSIEANRIDVVTRTMNFSFNMQNPVGFGIESLREKLDIVPDEPIPHEVRPAEQQRQDNEDAKAHGTSKSHVVTDMTEEKERQRKATNTNQPATGPVRSAKDAIIHPEPPSNNLTRAKMEEEKRANQADQPVAPVAPKSDAELGREQAAKMKAAAAAKKNK